MMIAVTESQLGKKWQVLCVAVVSQVTMKAGILKVLAVDRVIWPTWFVC